MDKWVIAASKEPHDADLLDARASGVEVAGRLGRQAEALKKSSHLVGMPEGNRLHVLDPEGLVAGA